jgi:hypothetical protein
VKCKKGFVKKSGKCVEKKHGRPRRSGRRERGESRGSR